MPGLTSSSVARALHRNLSAVPVICTASAVPRTGMCHVSGPADIKPGGWATVTVTSPVATRSDVGQKLSGTCSIANGCTVCVVDASSSIMAISCEDMLQPTHASTGSEKGLRHDTTPCDDVPSTATSVVVSAATGGAPLPDTAKSWTPMSSLSTRTTPSSNRDSEHGVYSSVRSAVL